MTFDWKEYLNLARILNGEEDTEPLTREAAARSGVSRAYYAAFCYARDKLGFVLLGEAEDHGRLRNMLQQIMRFRMTAARLDGLRKLRNQCDYNDELSVDLGDLLSFAIDAAQNVIDSLT